MINVIVNENTAELMLNGDFDTLMAELIIEIAAIADRLTTNKKEFEKFKFIITEMINSVDYEKIKNEIGVCEKWN